MMAASSLRAALYARVSTEHQAKVHTIGSELDALKQRMAHDGLKLDPELVFIDDGYSGEVLERHALERLRDQVAAGAATSSRPTGSPASAPIRCSWSRSSSGPAPRSLSSTTPLTRR